jgi:integrase
MATFRKRGDRWQVQIRRSDFDAKSRSFISRQDAEKWARTIERQMDLGEASNPHQVLGEITLGDLVNRYIAEVVCLKRSKDYEEIILNAFCRHPICRIKLRCLGPADFADYRAERLQTISPASLRRQLNPVQNMFEVAKNEWGIPLKENPLTKVKLACPATHRERRLREGELESIFLEAAKTGNKFILPIILFALETGLRRSEILSATWGNLDFTNRLLTIPKSKNGYSRTVPLTRKAIALLESLADAREIDREMDQLRIFPTTANAIRLAWGRLIKRAAIEDMHFHDLRHEAISRFFEYGLTLPEVALLSGHRDLRMLFRYGHATRARIFKRLG